MNKYFITYANSFFKLQQQRNAKQAREIGKLENIITFGPDDIDDEFYHANKKILTKGRGGGFWLWKPYFIHQMLTDSHIKDGDIILYCDAGLAILKDLNPLFMLPEKYNQDVILFENSHNLYFTKRDAYVLMNCDNQAAYDSNMIAANIMLFRKSKISIAYIKEVLHFACDYRIISDCHSKLAPELPEFKAHRHDQSILSLIAHKQSLTICPIEGVLYCGDRDLLNGKKPETYLMKAEYICDRNLWQKFLLQIFIAPELYWHDKPIVRVIKMIGWIIKLKIKRILKLF